MGVQVVFFWDLNVRWTVALSCHCHCRYPIHLCAGVAPYSPIPIIGALTFVLGVSMVKDGYEDYKRAKEDKIVNSRTVSVWIDGGWKESHWEDLQVHIPSTKGRKGPTYEFSSCLPVKFQRRFANLQHPSDR